MKSGLPIDEALPALTGALASHRSAVLQAPPGAGKSTVVPLVLLEQPWSTGKRIIMLEPRRLAARTVAQRMAHTLREGVGRTVGYRMRMDTRVSRDTRIEVVTEGVLTRLLQSDPALEGVAAVVFDEFHERSLQADLGLALVLDARANLSPELKILVMSATLDGAAVADLLENAPIVTASGRMFPVATRFVGRSSPPLPSPESGPGRRHESEQLVTQAIIQALREEEAGDVLVFLPGAREIRRVQGLLEDAGPSRSVHVLPLFGDLSAEEQDAALAPAERGTRKVVLATNIAETSLTIEGVCVVVDSGLVRRSLFDPVTGMSRLETQRISRASAEQRQGRAGRLGPGVCYRIWSETSQRSLAPFTSPEIVEADLVPLALELARWGVRDPSELRWLDEPPAATLASARDLLLRLGAIDSHSRITAHGRRMAQLGTHPRLAHMLLESVEFHSLALAADLAAVLSERDLLRGPGRGDADIRTRLEAFRRSPRAGGAERWEARRARQVAGDLRRQVLAALDEQGGRHDQGDAATSSSESPNDENVGLLLAFAYPDRVGRRRPGGEGRYTLANGRGAHFAEAQSLARNEYIVALDLDDRDRDARILLAAPVRRTDIEAHMADHLERGESVEWNPREQAVLSRRFVRLGAILLEEKPLPEVPADAARQAMLEGIRQLGIDALPWTSEARELQARMEFVRRLLGPEHVWPVVTDAHLTESTEAWLAPWLDGITRREHLARLQIAEILQGMLSWEQQRQLSEMAPTHLTVPSGSHIRIDYRDESAPAVSVRLQEVFGLEATPRIGQGRVPITFKLLSPARRPVQVTRDLASFWRGAYAEVRKDLRGRYPRHYWPENPLDAEPTRGVRRRT
ncbi:MAG TPA: ATP-dependent helicase HrpB [Steroidobacteraceae bacterium]|nr:ATP-dependent helicase HrpB [Steroidobacteraceae bacterium]